MSFEENSSVFDPFPQSDDLHSKVILDDSPVIKHMLQRVYQQLYDEYVGSMKTEKFLGKIEIDDD